MPQAQVRTIDDVGAHVICNQLGIDPDSLDSEDWEIFKWTAVQVRRCMANAEELMKGK